ncbi:hypothetical protein BLA13014_08252 [Burkholderia aenigmatica]|uniref:Uncharacterized protein n=1 Tax=Burkholderia aenigmatica TaxID=2015348 RepID=A0A6P2ST17_9BURK|nr:hypothetical protein [Burkholderia aenigmatica]VWC53716.1 hypothetical protein BLA13014_08252 [Burkholderia aenigmatica]
MKQQNIKSFIAPILVGKVFPYAVLVKATDADGPGEYEANGLMYENGHVLLEYPFRRPGQSIEQATVESADSANQNQIDITTAVLPDGTELTRGEAWEEISYPSSWADRVKAAIAAHGEASFLRGDHRLSDDGHAEGARLSAELNQAEDNLYRLLGLKANVDEERTRIKVAVLCDNSQGIPEIRTFELPVSDVDIDEGEHYDVAIERAVAEGYGGKMVAFDEHDQAARYLFETAAWFTK